MVFSRGYAHDLSYRNTHSTRRQRVSPSAQNSLKKSSAGLFLSMRVGRDVEQRLVVSVSAGRDVEQQLVVSVKVGRDVE